jgi:hypothetical protein
MKDLTHKKQLEDIAEASSDHPLRLGMCICCLIVYLKPEDDPTAARRSKSCAAGALSALQGGAVDRTQARRSQTALSHSDRSFSRPLTRMLVAFSNQDAKKVEAVAGSMRDAFGVQKEARYSGILENDGMIMTRSQIKHAAHIEPEDSSVTPTPDEHGSTLGNASALALAAASLRQMLQDMPELTEVSSGSSDIAEGLIER